MADEKLPKVKSVNPTLNVMEEERDLETLAAGLSLATTKTIPKLELDSNGKPVKRRTLDDMRRLSEHIKNKQRHK
jgi:hypothetical protein